jgi:tRNA 2-thiouridine synthesizing protein C
MQSTKKILFISRSAPYGEIKAKEALDATLAASVYEQELSLMFMDDGVFQLLKGQQGELIAQKNFNKMLSALPIYGVDNIFVHDESLAQRSLTKTDLILDSIKIISSREVGELFAQQDQLLSF